MSKQKFLLLLDDLFEEDPGTLSGEERLEDLEIWDSLTALGFIALIDDEFNLIISGDEIEKCLTVNDLIGLVQQDVVE
ncbi:acyl carrier protein [bacterium]|nr:acyl carrier protein [bacterium]